MNAAPDKSGSAVGAQTCCARSKIALRTVRGRSKTAPLHGLFLAAVLLFAGCHILPAPQADAARFYALTAKVIPDQDRLVQAPPSRTLRLGLARVELPTYLQNRAMVIRTGSEIRYEQNHRWAEPLDEGIARILRDALRAARRVAAVRAAPFSIDEPRDYDVTVRVSRCEGVRDAAGRAAGQFAFTLEVTRADAAHTPVLRKEIPATNVPWDGSDFSALAAALGDAFAEVAVNVSDALPVN